MLVSGVFYDASGALPSITISFTADKTTLNGVLVASSAEFATQEDGSYAIELEPGYYTVRWGGGKSLTKVLGRIVADESSTLTLPQALEASPTPISASDAEDYLAQMRDEADRAESAASTATGARDTAVSAANTATSAASSAQTDAGTAEDDRILVQGLASQVNSDAADAVVAKNQAEAARDAAVAIADPEGQIEAAFDIWVKDVERQALENATGGACTIERTANGQACYMFVLPKMKWEDLVPSGELGTGVHEAFLESGVEKSELLIGMYQASTVNGELVSQARKVPRRSINWDASRTEAQAAGFDMMSNWEWSAIAFWCMANGYQPTGNTDFGRSHSDPYQRGVYDDDSVSNEYTLLGSGPNEWNHNNAANGIADLVGNRWEWVRGFKMIDGRVFLAPDNDPSLTDSAWADSGYDLPSDANPWSSLTQAGATQQVQRALIVPNGVADPDGRLYANLTGERFPIRGGNRGDAADAGLGALSLGVERSYANTVLGLRLSRLV